MDNWTCDQMEQFEPVELICQISTLACKGIELIIYLFLVYRFTRRFQDERARKQGGQTAILTLIVALIVTLEIIFYVLRMNAIFPIWQSTEPDSMTKFLYFNVLSINLYLSALVIFSLKYHQAAS